MNICGCGGIMRNLGVDCGRELGLRQRKEKLKKSRQKLIKKVKKGSDGEKCLEIKGNF